MSTNYQANQVFELDEVLYRRIRALDCPGDVVDPDALRGENMSCGRSSMCEAADVVEPPRCAVAYARVSDLEGHTFEVDSVEYLVKVVHRPTRAKTWWGVPNAPHTEVRLCNPETGAELEAWPKPVKNKFKDEMSKIFKPFSHELLAKQLSERNMEPGKFAELFDS